MIEPAIEISGEDSLDVIAKIALVNDLIRTIHQVAEWGLREVPPHLQDDNVLYLSPENALIMIQQKCRDYVLAVQRTNVTPKKKLYPNKQRGYRKETMP